MCRITKRMETLLQGEAKSTTTMCIKLLAESQDENFKTLDTKLNEVIKLLQENTLSTDKKIETLEQNYEHKCAEHKIELTKKFKEIDTSTESLTYFNKHPKLLLILAIGLVFIIGLSLGHSNILNIFKIV